MDYYSEIKRLQNQVESLESQVKLLADLHKAQKESFEKQIDLVTKYVKDSNDAVVKAFESLVPKEEPTGLANLIREATGKNDDREL